MRPRHRDWRPPPPPYQLNWDHPLAQGLAYASLDGLVDLVRRGVGSRTGTAPAATPHLGRVRGYGSTLGAGTTDGMRTTLTTHATQRSYLLWANRRGAGGGSTGRMFDKHTGTSQVEVFYIASGTYRYNRAWSTNPGEWTMTITPGTGEWTQLGVTYDASSDANHALMYADGIPKTVSRNSTPSGTVQTNVDAYVLGNRQSDNARVWDGLLGPFLVWDRILTPVEYVQLYDPSTRWDWLWARRRVWFDIGAEPVGPSAFNALLLSGD
jgi:hypothetical protein